MKEGWRGGDCIGRGDGVGGVAEWKGAGCGGVRAVEMRKTKRVGDHREGHGSGREEERDRQRGRDHHVRKDGNGEGTTGRGGRGKEREGTIGGKSGRPRKGERESGAGEERRHHIKPRRAEKKRFALPDPPNPPRGKPGGSGTALAIYRGGRGFSAGEDRRG